MWFLVFLLSLMIGCIIMLYRNNIVYSATTHANMLWFSYAQKFHTTYPVKEMCYKVSLREYQELLEDANKFYGFYKELPSYDRMVLLQLTKWTPQSLLKGYEAKLINHWIYIEDKINKLTQ